MRIVYCTPEISHPGGIGRVTTIKANWLAEHGHEVFLVTSSQCGESDYFDLSPNVKHIDFGIGFQAGMDNTNVIKKLINKRDKMRKYENSLRGFIYKIKPDIVVSTFSNDSDFLYKFNDGSIKILEYHFSHDGYKSVIKYGNLGFLQSLVLLFKIHKQESIAKKYDAFVVLTHEDAESWKGYKNLHVIPNMLTFESTKLSDCKTKRVIAVGRLDYQKKFDRLISIWERVHKNCPDWVLDIYGKGPDKSMLLEMIREKGLVDTVRINNPVRNIEEEYLKSSVLSMTSTYEGWGLVLTEAMTFGLPCIAYACKCGPRDIITDGQDGYLIDENNIELYVEKMCYLLTNPITLKKYGIAAKNKSNNYKVDIIMKKWEELFQKLVNESTLK